MIFEYDLTRTASAAFSPCRRYRYTLRRCFRGTVDEPPRHPIYFAMLNPSTADAFVADRTIRRCIGYALAWGHSDLVVVNCFAHRSTDPDDLLRVDDPIGPENDEALRSLPPGPVVAGWGNHDALRGRVEHVVELLGRPVACLKRNKDGSPAHPLYLKADLLPVPWAQKKK